MNGDATGSVVKTTYAGFWLRALALLIDSVLLSIPVLTLTVLILIAVADQPDAGPVLVVIQFVVFVGYWLYFAILESSTRQATIGKRLLNIRVTDLEGGQISFWRATGRYFGKNISTMILGIGFILAAFTERRQALHDLMAGCLVLRAQPDVPPPQIQIPSSPPLPPDMSNAQTAR